MAINISSLEGRERVNTVLEQVRAVMATDAPHCELCVNEHGGLYYVGSGLVALVAGHQLGQEDLFIKIMNDADKLQPPTKAIIIPGNN